MTPDYAVVCRAARPRSSMWFTASAARHLASRASVQTSAAASKAARTTSPSAAVLRMGLRIGVIARLCGLMVVLLRAVQHVLGHTWKGKPGLPGRPGRGQYPSGVRRRSPNLRLHVRARRERHVGTRNAVDATCPPRSELRLAAPQRRWRRRWRSCSRARGSRGPSRATSASADHRARANCLPLTLTTFIFMLITKSVLNYKRLQAYSFFSKPITNNEH